MENKIYDLTNSQKSIWFTEQFYTGTSIGNISGNILIDEIVDFSALEKALNIYVQKNEAIRLRILVQNGIPKQYIKDYSPFSINTILVKDEAELEKLNVEFSNTPFNLTNSDLFRFTLFKFPNGFGGLNVTFHHIVSDAWTMSLFIDETISLYSKLINKEEIDYTINPSYTQYIETENKYLKGSKYKKDTDYWNNIFNFEPQSSKFAEFKNDVISTMAKRETFKLDEQTYSRILSFCKETKCSVFTFLTGIYSIYLSRINNMDYSIIGTPVLNRSNYAEKHTAGMFISTVPLYLKVNPNTNFSNFISDVGINQMSIFRHQKYPYDLILQNIRNKYPDTSNLYDVLLSYQNARDNCELSNIKYHTKWLFNGHLSDSVNIHIYDMDDNGILDIYYDYQICKLNKNDIINIHNRILNIINQVLNNNNILLKDIELISLSEHNKIIVEFNSTELNYDKTKTLIDLFEYQVKTVPNKIAVKYKDEELTYKELYEKVCNCAYILRQKGVKNNVIVSILLPRSIDMIIGILAVVKAGGCYNPIDTSLPQDRIITILKDCNPMYILSIENYCKLYNTSFNCIDIKTIKNVRATDTLQSISSPDDLCYIIYTSGSTGKPKGVSILNRNLVGLLNSIHKVLKTTSNDVVSMFHTYCFDVSVMEMYNALTNGAKLVILSDEDYKNPSKLLKLLRKQQVTILQQTPSYFYKTAEFETDFEDSNLSLHTIILAGEQVQSKNLLKFKTKYPNIKIYNGYGPTEATILSTIGEITKEQMINNEINIGNILNNYKIYILDNYLKPVPIGCKGRMYISGIGITNGYLNRKDLTKEKFIEDPFNGGIMYDTGDICNFTQDGKIEFWGRIDDQVKVNGYRIELEEIQNKMLGFKNLNHPIVIAIKDSQKGSNFLVGFYLSQENIDENELKEYLNTILPAYEVPSYFIKLDKYPYTISGKVDKKELISLFKKYSTKNSVITLPSNDIEQTIYDVISSINNIETFSITDNFSSIGMDSLNILTALIKLKTFNLKAQDFYDFPTIQLLAKKIENNITNELQSNIRFKDLKIENNSKKFDLSNILITGSTGYLGIHILNELINNPNVKKIYCLIREKNGLTPKERLDEKIKYYFGNIDVSKIQIVEGELTKENLNIEPTKYNELLNNITTVINVAANVSHIGNYNYFYNDNVNTVKNLIDFCKQSSASLAHISTISIAGYTDISKQDILDFTENMLYKNQELYNNVYLITKLLAETEIIENTHSNNINAKIFRLGNIMPRYSDGMFQYNKLDNAFINRLNSLIHIGKLPNNYKNYTVELSPVDFCSRAILTLLSNKDNQTIYHINNPNTIRLLTLLETLANKTISLVELVDFNNHLSSYSTNYTKYLFELNSNTNIVENKVNNEITIQKLNKQNFYWPDYTSDYLSNIENLLTKE